jgi:hypothetical protein
MDPTTLINHPVPVRNLILEIPQRLLSTLVTRYDKAYQPRELTVTSLTPAAITISYLQPLREVYYNPIPRSATIPFNPPLPPIPKSGNDKDAYEWEKLCAERLKQMEEESERINDDRSDIVVTRYLPPNQLGGFFSIAWFAVLTVIIGLWIAHGAEIPYIGAFLAEKVFNEEWKFNATTLVHAGILVKKSRDVFNLLEKLRRHGVDKRRGIWLCWVVDVALEGWRCTKRFDEEVARVGRAMAAEQKGGESRKAK